MLSSRMLPSIIAMNGMASRLGAGPEGPGGPMDFPGAGAPKGPPERQNAPQGRSPGRATPAGPDRTPATRRARCPAR